MGRIQNSWNLVKQSFAVLRSDKVLMLYPVLSAIACVVVTGMVFAGGGIAAYPAIRVALQAHTNWQPSPPLVIAGVFLFYLINYFVTALSG